MSHAFAIMMIEIRLDMAKTRIPTMTDQELAEACSEVLRLQNFEMLNVINPDDLEELFALIGMEVKARALVENKGWLLRRRTDRP
jgi:hypothetical protein